MFSNGLHFSGRKQRHLKTATAVRPTCRHSPAPPRNKNLWITTITTWSKPTPETLLFEDVAVVKKADRWSDDFHSDTEFQDSFFRHCFSKLRNNMDTKCEKNYSKFQIKIDIFVNKFTSAISVVDQP